ncbi:MAG: kelch repeat-containing protein [Turneriella sp.]
MFKSIFRSAVPVLFLSFFVTYCSKSNDVAQGNDANAGKLQPNSLTKASAAISAETGGYINVGSMQLVIPQGAIASDTQITAELTDIPANVPGAQKIGKGIKFSPEGLQFLSPAELTICYDQAAVNGLNENSTMVYYKTENGELVGIAGQVNPGTHCVKSHIEHFSSYIAVAQAQVAGNTAPTIAGANFLPTTPLAGIPLRVRTQINDVNGGAVTGQIVSAFFIWCRTGDTTCNLNPATATNKVPLQPDTTDDTVTNRYYYLLPASAVTLDGIDYRFQATDNLNMTTTTAIVTRSVPSAANGIQFNVTTLNIGAGFTRALTLQASDNAPAGPWQNISIENQNLSNGALGSVVRSGPSSIRISTTGAGTGTISSTAGAFTANMTVNVIAGLLTHIEITDLNQVHLTGTYQIGTNQTVDFDAVGYDAFGNISTIKPVFSTTGGIGTMLIDATGAHFTAGSTATTGTLTATIAGISDALDILVYVPPAVASTAPVDGATNVNYVGANIAVTFTKSMDTATLTATTTTACTGSIQVSSNGFVDCVPMTSATPVFFSGNALAIVTPAAPLAGNTTYRVRVLATARDTFNYPMAATYTSATGFLTIPDVTPPVAGAGIVISAVTPHSVTLTWGAATDDSSIAANIEYKVVKDHNSESNINTVALVDARIGSDIVRNWTAGQTTITIRNLPTGRPMHFAVLARDSSANMSLYSPVSQPMPLGWEATGSMITGRYLHTATLLADGRVLITGGSATGPTLASAEIFDPNANGGIGSFQSTGSMSTGRYEHTATLMGDGRVLVAGGYNGSSYVASAEIFDPNANGGIGAFTTTGNLATGSGSHTATRLPNGRVLLIGGQSMSSQSAIVQIFDPTGNGGIGAFTAMTSLNVARAAHTTTLLNDGRLLVTGGHNSTGFLSSAELYDASANAGLGASVNTAAMGAARYLDSTTLMFGGIALVSGGFSGSGQVTLNEIFNPTGNSGAGTFTATGNMVLSRYNHTSARLSDGSVLIIGGKNGSSFLAAAEIFNPAANAGAGAFSTTASMSTPRIWHTATRLQSGIILVIGGYNGSAATGIAEIY